MEYPSQIKTELSDGSTSTQAAGCMSSAADPYCRLETILQRALDAAERRADREMIRHYIGLLMEEASIALWPPEENGKLRSNKLRVVIVHRFHHPGTDCCPGEEILVILLVHQGREYVLRLSTGTTMLFDYIARQRFGQSASQIAVGIRHNAFFVKYGPNPIGSGRRRRISRTSIKEYIKRIRQALSLAFKEAGIDLNPCDILQSEKTVGNEVKYRLRANVEWRHTS